VTAIRFSRLGDIAQYLRGINFKPDDVVAVGTAGTVACMRTKNIQESLDCSDVWGVAEAFVRRPEQILQVGDILVSSANSWNLVGKCCWIPELPWKSTFGGFVSALRAKPNQVDQRFLFWWFSSDRTQALLRSFGQKTTSISNLNSERCLNLDVPLPPLPEQRRIAAILDQADALRAKRREALAQLDSLAQSIFIEMFGDPSSNPKGWPAKRLSNLVISGDSINYGVIQPGDDVDDGIPLVRVGDLIDGGVRHELLKKITPEIESAYKRSRLHGDEILVSCVGTIGVVVLAKESEKGFNIARAVARIRLSPGTSREFVAAQLQTESVQRYFTEELRTVSQPTLNIKQLSETKLIWPPAPLQAEFSKRIDSLEKLKFNAHQASCELNTLFASLQHRAFRGEL
jgi:type I restriction enzyme S subunit